MEKLYAWGLAVLCYFTPFITMTTGATSDSPCYKRVNEVFCDNRNLRKFPTEPMDIRADTAYLNNNSISSIPANAFDMSPYFQKLDLSFNAFTSLPSNVFQRVRNLNYLRFTGNQLTSLPVGIFGNLTRLTFLYLDHNRLTGLNQTVFSGLVSLQMLYLQNNALSQLPEGVFNSLPNLRTLDIGYNELSMVPYEVFDFLVNLKRLILAGNMFQNLPRDIFATLTNMHTLKLERNQFRGLANEIFDTLADLRTLNLRDNNIAYFPAGIFNNLTNLAHIRIDGNPVLTYHHVSLCELLPIMPETSETELLTPRSPSCPEETHCYRDGTQNGYYCRCSPENPIFDGRACVNASTCNKTDPASPCYIYPTCVPDVEAMDSCVCPPEYTLFEYRCRGPPKLNYSKQQEGFRKADVQMSCKIKSDKELNVVWSTTNGNGKLRVGISTATTHRSFPGGVVVTKSTLTIRNTHYIDQGQYTCQAAYSYPLPDGSVKSHLMRGTTSLTVVEDVDACAQSPCQNKGQCIDEPGSYHCNCKAGTTGRHCETEIDECDSSPCQNGAQCREDGIGYYSCQCTDGYFGQQCDIDVHVVTGLSPAAAGNKADEPFSGHTMVIVVGGGVGGALLACAIIGFIAVRHRDRRLAARSRAVHPQVAALRSQNSRARILELGINCSPKELESDGNQSDSAFAPETPQSGREIAL